jgi:hypothetical protein
MASLTDSQLPQRIDGGQVSPPIEAPPRTRGTSGGPGLVRLTVNLTKRSHEEVMRLSDETGLGKTDIVNRALQLYALIEELLNKGDGRLTVVHPDGRQERIYIL